MEVQRDCPTVQVGVFMPTLFLEIFLASKWVGERVDENKGHLIGTPHRRIVPA